MGELELEWGLDEAFSMAMADPRRADQATDVAAGKPVLAAVGRGGYTDKGIPDGGNSSRQGLCEKNDEKGNGKGAVSNATGGDGRPVSYTHLTLPTNREV